MFETREKMTATITVHKKDNKPFEREKNMWTTRILNGWSDEVKSVFKRSSRLISS